jgi:rubrerythrin
MGLLETEPEGVVLSLPELMAIAKALEDEAADRYRQLVRRMQIIGNKAAEEIFAHLAHEEENHASKVAELSQAVVGAPPSAANIRWELPKDLEDEGMSDLAASRLVTPYRALSIAVRNEERAFAFWSYVSAFSPNETIREYAEKMAREELRHASILRKERRRAYHQGPQAAPRPAVKNLTELKKQAAALETKIVEACAPAVAAGEDQASADMLARIGEESKLNMQALGVSSIEVVTGEENTNEQGSVESLAALDRVITAMEAAAEGYLAIAESARDEGAVSAAHRLSKSAISRLTRLRQRRAQLAPVEFEDEP